MASANQVDIIIVGGGMVGLTLALALADTELKILLLDSHAMSMPEAGAAPELRVSAITRASQNIFRNLGCWQNIQALGVSCFDKMHVWDACGEGAISFDAAEIAEPDLGHIIENKKICTGIWQSLKNFDNVTLLAPVKAEQANWDQKGGHIRLENGETWSANLLVAADGANSWLRQQRNIKVSEKPYAHDALVCNISTEEEHENCAWQRFLPSGPLALLPLADKHQCSIVWSNSAAEVERLKSLSESEFNQQLSAAFEQRLGQLSVQSDRLSFPLVRRHVTHYVDNGIALVGDAAHTIHPLAGQGVNLGLMDAASLAEVLISALTKQQSIANRQVLRPYERWRRSENLLMLEAMGFFRQLFDGEQASRVWLRNNGLRFVNAMPMIKNEVIQRAMGLKGDLPELTKTMRDPALDCDK